MKRYFNLILPLLAALAAASLCGCSLLRTLPVEGYKIIYRATPAPTEAPSQAPTEAPAATPEATAEQTASPTEAPTESPAPTPNDGMLQLINFEHPALDSAEPVVVPIAEYLTAQNVTCDPRRHANVRAVRALNEMLLAAQSEGEFHFIIASAFRSLYEQEVLWAPRVAEEPDYGSDPHASPVCVMPPGCSEHFTGLAFDILSDSCPHSDVLFARSAEGLWLAANAHRFGFILRFPEDKQFITGVQFEPWHFRFVGTEAAGYIYEHGLCLEEYLGCVYEG